MTTTAPTARLLALAALLVLCASCKSTAPDKRLLQYLNDKGFGNRYTGNAEEQNYVTIGDSISIFDAYHDELDLTETVAIDGTVVLPEIGAVHIAGQTRSELEAFLTQKYTPYYEQLDIAIKLNTATSKVYFIFGEVAARGSKPFPGDLTVFEAVMEATPDDRTANLGRVRLIRADPRDPLIIPVNISDMLDRGDSTFNVHVQERDIIYVPPTMLAELGYFLSGLIFPITEVINQLGGAFFIFTRNNFNRQGPVF
ncbi:MAG TPA: polysaccharide biosynthesis/export family protein [Planctomycetota bacterium]|nr:polysaccharide biosynthesis/export family protein [Planctomycetota bacterium]